MPASGKRGNVRLGLLRQSELMNPLPDTHPQLSVLYPTKGVVEFKVKNSKFQEFNGSRKKKYHISLILMVCCTGILFKLGYTGSIPHILLWIFYLYIKSTQVLYESILLMPHHGIQLETRRGFKLPFLSPFQLTAKRRFIPRASVREIVINEGLRRWDVRYYLCIVRDTGLEVTLEVAFENLLPHLPTLEVAYRLIHETLYQNL